MYFRCAESRFGSRIERLPLQIEKAEFQLQLYEHTWRGAGSDRGYTYVPIPRRLIFKWNGSEVTNKESFSQTRRI